MHAQVHPHQPRDTHTPTRTHYTSLHATVLDSIVNPTALIQNHVTPCSHMLSGRRLSPRWSQVNGARFCQNHGPGRIATTTTCCSLATVSICSSWLRPVYSKDCVFASLMSPGGRIDWTLVWLKWRDWSQLKRWVRHPRKLDIPSPLYCQGGNRSWQPLYIEQCCFQEISFVVLLLLTKEPVANETDIFKQCNE